MPAVAATAWLLAVRPVTMIIPTTQQLLEMARLVQAANRQALLRREDAARTVRKAATRTQ